MSISLYQPAKTPLSKGLLTAACIFFAADLWLGIAGCSRFHAKPPVEVVYVVSKQTFLRERVAPVSNRVAQVENGQRLEVVEHGRRFLKVKTDKNEIGWIEERAVIDSGIYDGFAELKKQHESDPVVATAVLRDDLYMHLKPGRDTDRFFLLPENEKLQLLMRASVPKLVVQGATPKPVVSAPAKGAKAAAKAKAAAVDAPPLAPPDATPMEDWWLVRDSKGDAGWLLARRMDVDVPEEIGGYAEGQKMVGAYILTKVQDDESTLSDKMVPEYVAVLNAFKDGLPYDFDQVRVFTWNTKKHRYETAFRQHGLLGYLPVTIGRQTFDAAGPVPTFSFRQATGPDPSIDPETGVAKAPQTEVTTFRMDGVLVKRVGPPSPAVPKTTEQIAEAKARHASRAAAKKRRR